MLTPDFQSLARELRAVIADSVTFPVFGETQDDREARRSAGLLATRRAQYVPAAGGPEFLRACGVRNT